MSWIIVKILETGLHVPQIWYYGKKDAVHYPLHLSRQQIQKAIKNELTGNILSIPVGRSSEPKSTENNDFIDERFKQLLTITIKNKKMLEDHEKKNGHYIKNLDEIKLMLSKTITSDLNYSDQRDLFDMLPVTTITKLDDLENILTEKVTRDKFVSYSINQF